jgi:pimeloyl-ACP methyl ester carboxylesterase
MQRFQSPTPESVLQFALFMNEDETLPEHPGLIELLVAVGRDASSAGTSLAEARAIVSPFALISRSGFRSHLCVRPEEDRQLTVPTLLVSGEHELGGGVTVAEAVTDLISQSQLEVLPAGHAPWLGHPMASLNGW